VAAFSRKKNSLAAVVRFFDRIDSYP